MDSQNIRNLLIKSYDARPEMKIEDYVKLLYQSEFGGGHIITDESGSLARLEKEWNETPPDADLPLFENIGGGLCRVNIAAAKTTGIGICTVNRAFFQTAASTRGSREGFEEKLFVLSDCSIRGLLPISHNKLSDFISDYMGKDCPPISHSVAYREKYNPAYRLADSEFAEFFPLFCLIDKALANKPQIIVAIDGMCASGKTTLAEYLTQIYKASVIHMDHFFLRPFQRTAERLNEPGGNIDYERFSLEILPEFNQSFKYRAFDCRTGDLSDIIVPQSRVTVIEGAYSLHPRIGLEPDISIFIKLSPAEQSKRILRRSGEKLHRRFIDEWIPMENRYFDEFCIEEECDLTFYTS